MHPNLREGLGQRPEVVEMASVVIPTLNEEQTISSVVRMAIQSSGVEEVLVIDDGSLDRTREHARQAGARVQFSTLLGKGASMADGVREAISDVILFLDGDLHGVVGDLISKMLAPLTNGTAELVKAAFSRNSGRVTTLTAKPLLRTFFPEIHAFRQPLGGIVAARRNLLQELDFEDDYGVDIGILIDAHQRGSRIVEVDIGRLEHDPQTLEALGHMAGQVVRTILDRAERYSKLSGTHMSQARELHRHAQANIDMLPRHLLEQQPVVLLPMDHVLIRGSYIEELAAQTGVLPKLRRLLSQSHAEPASQLRDITRLFAGVPQANFAHVARTLPLQAGTAEAVVALRRAGWSVGVVDHCYHIATEILRKRVFADFSVANLTDFQQGECTGELVFSPALSHPSACRHQYCKTSLIRHLQGIFQVSPQRIAMVGHDHRDLCALKHSGMRLASSTARKRIRKQAQIVFGDTGLGELPALLEQRAW
jgi:glucosyl-3-phosphoglycerate synthase